MPLAAIRPPSLHTNLNLGVPPPNRKLKPGGYIEIVDFRTGVFCDDGTMPDNYPLLRYFELLTRAMRTSYSMHAQGPDGLSLMLSRAGYVTPVSRKTFKIPIGPWARDRRRRLVGLYMQKQMADFFPAAAAKPFASLGMSREEIDSLVEECKRAITDLSVHAYTSLHFVWAQKPMPATGAASTGNDSGMEEEDEL